MKVLVKIALITRFVFPATVVLLGCLGFAGIINTGHVLWAGMFMLLGSFSFVMNFVEIFGRGLWVSKN